MSSSDHYERFFNTAGFVNCADHYCLPPLSRFNLDEILSLIHQKKYFILHAPRQTGKTSCLLTLMEYLNSRAHYWAVYTNFEKGQAARENVAGAMNALMGEVTFRTSRYTGYSIERDKVRNLWEEYGPFGALGTLLTELSQSLDRPLVLFIDEIDALVGDTLISVLRQLRSGYDLRPSAFPQSIILCGLRDLKDYRIYSDIEKAIITGGSAFNIKAKSLRLGNFSEEEVRTLCLQHTEDTGQVFEESALESIWYYSQGQPWLVNALAYETCFEIIEGRNRTYPITKEMVIQAKENLIIRRETHIDQLTDKLREERVRHVIGPMLEGSNISASIPWDDIEYVVDLGLIKESKDGLVCSNPIYQEVIPRELNIILLKNFESIIKPASFVKTDGYLDSHKIFKEFQQFFRENSNSWLELFQYKQAGPQLLLQAYLQRIVNSGGRIEREYGFGKWRIDLFIIWPVPGGDDQRIVIELKIFRWSLKKTINDGLAQVYRYADESGAKEAHLIIFDTRPKKAWDQKIFRKDEIYHGTEDHKIEFPVTVWGM